MVMLESGRDRWLLWYFLGTRNIEGEMILEFRDAVDIEANMRHIHTSIFSRHLATTGNNQILHTLLPHISSSEETLPRHTRRTLAQLRTNKLPFHKLYVHKVDANSHESPQFVTYTQDLFNRITL